MARYEIEALLMREIFNIIFLSNTHFTPNPCCLQDLSIISTRSHAKGLYI